jgi:hypothetical protein
MRWLKFLNILFLIFLVGCQSVTASQPTATATLYPTQVVKTDLPDKVEITEISFTPLTNGQIGINVCTRGLGGVGITLRVSYNSSHKAVESGEWRVIKELGVPCFNQYDRPVWETKDLPAGTYLVKVEAKTPANPDWKNAVFKIQPYKLAK